MSKIAFTETTGRTNYVDSAWTDDDKALFNTLDNSGVLLTYAQKMAIYNWGLSIKATIASGVRSTTAVIDADSAGSTYTVNGALQSVMVVLNNVPLQSGYTFNNGTWSFTAPLSIDDTLTLIYL